MKRLCVKLTILVTISLVFHTSRCFGYSVLTHEAIIDANWNIVLVPLIKQKYSMKSCVKDYLEAYSQLMGTVHEASQLM